MVCAHLKEIATPQPRRVPSCPALHPGNVRVGLVVGDGAEGGGAETGWPVEAAGCVALPARGRHSGGEPGD